MLSDVLSQTDLTPAPVLGLVLLFGAFVGLLLWTMSRRRDEEFERAASLPLDDGSQEQGGDR